MCAPFDGGGGEWMLWTVIAEPAVLAETIVFFHEQRASGRLCFFREQRASGRLCFSVSREPLDGCVFSVSREPLDGCVLL
jgi:hypothetical protein